MKDAVTEAEQRTGKPHRLRFTPTINVGDDPAPWAKPRRTIENNARAWRGVLPAAHLLYGPAGGRTRPDHPNMRRTAAGCGSADDTGLSTHMPESIVFADETNLDVGTYIGIYNAAGFLMHVEVDWMHGSSGMPSIRS